MDLFAISLAVVSGICLGTGLFHLFIGLRRQGADMVHFSFGLFALAYGGAVLTGLLMYRANSLPQYLAMDRWSGAFAVTTHIFLLWFAAIYTDVQPLPLLAALTALFATALAAHLSRPTLFHGEIAGLAMVTLPWGEEIAFLDAAGSTWQFVYFAAQLLTIGFLFYACARQYRRGERGGALALGAGVLFFVATIIFDMFVETGAIDFVLASDYGFLGLALVMSLKMSNDIIRTEEELAGYRRTLELLVDERTASLQRVNEELAALNRIAQTVSTVTDLPTALTQVSETVTELFHASHTYIILPEVGQDDLQVLAGFGREAGRFEDMSLPVALSEAPHTRQVLNRAESLVLTEVPSLPLAPFVREAVTTLNVASMMLVPLVVHGAATGLIVVATDEADRVFTTNEVRLAETVAADVAGAIENARLTEQAQAAAVSEERARIARDLHDAVSQTIYSASLIAEVLPRVWERSPAEGERNLVKLRQLVRGALAEMRTLLFELRPAALEAADLDTLLRYLGDALTGRTRIPVEVIAEEAAEGKKPLPPDVKVALYRITQEVFNNIAKHARATQATVTLHRMPERTMLTIQDNGRGFDPDSVSAAKLGLGIMRERAEQIGAQLAIESQAGQGTRIAVTWSADNTLLGTGGQGTNE